jgi:hypothetical protein
MTDYIVATLSEPKTPILPGPLLERLWCKRCGNDVQEKFLTVTDGTTLRGFVCGLCEVRAR